MNSHPIRYALSCVGYLLLICYALTPLMAFADEELTHCPNVGYYCRGAVNANCCGPDLSSPSVGATLSATVAEGSVVTDISGGTLHGCQWTGATPPTEAQLVAGSAPCVSKKTKEPSAGTVNFNVANSNQFDGLTSSTSYIAAYLHDDGTRRPIKELVTTASYTTLAGSPGGGDDLTNKGFFVAGTGETCSDSYNGLHPEFISGSSGPWCSLSKVNSSVTAAGSNVYEI